MKNCIEPEIDTGYTHGEVKLREIMNNNPLTIDISATSAEAATAMTKEDVGSCIVLKNGCPVGIVTEQDFTVKIIARNLMPNDVRVGDIMNTPLITVQENVLTSEAAKLMIKHKVRRLPITGIDGSVTGIVTVRDILGVTSELNDIMSELIAINRLDAPGRNCQMCGMLSNVDTTCERDDEDKI